MQSGLSASTRSSKRRWRIWTRAATREERIKSEAQQHHDKDEHNKQELEQTRLSLAQQIRAARRLRWLLVVLAAILLLALSAAGYFGFKLLTHLLRERAS